MTATRLTPSSEMVLSYLGNHWTAEDKLMRDARMERRTFDNGTRELVRDELVEVKFVGGTKCWRRTA